MRMGKVTKYMKPVSLDGYIASLKRRVQQLLNPRHAYSQSDEDTKPGEQGSNIIRSADWNIPKYSGSGLVETIRHGAGRWGKNVAFECAETGLQFTHNQVFTYSRNLGASLLKSGLKPDDVVTIALPNSPYYPIAFFSLLEAGLVGNLINPSLPRDDIGAMLDKTNTRGIITTPELAPSLAALKSQLKRVIISTGGAAGGVHSFKEMMNAGHDKNQSISSRSVDGDKLAMIFWTSGTTGAPKPVTVTQSAMVAQLHQVAHPSVSAYTHGKDVTLGLLPFYHAYPNIYLIRNATFVGSKVVTVPYFDPKTFSKTLTKYKPTVMPATPPLIKFLGSSDLIGRKDLSTLHTVPCGGAPSPPNIVERFLEKSRNQVFFQSSCGSSELGLAFTTPVSCKNIRTNSMGKLLPGTMAKIVDEDEINLSCGQKGELCVNGPQILSGYFANDSLTSAALDSDGWYRTGDYCHYDEEGYFYFDDRLEDIIRVQGIQVSSSELEAILNSHPSVRDSAVIGVEEGGIGQVPKAFLVSKDGNLKESEIQDFVKSKLPKHMYLQGGVTFVPEIPRSPVGKIYKHRLRGL